MIEKDILQDILQTQMAQFSLLRLSFSASNLGDEIYFRNVPFLVPLEVNVVLIGFNGDGKYRYPLDGHKLEEFLKTTFPFHMPSCFET
jgi:hypothetical protein